MAQIFREQLPLLSHVEILEIGVAEYDWADLWRPSRWLELLRPFIAVRSLYVSIKAMPLIVSTLQELAGGSAMEVLPVLCDLYVERWQRHSDEKEDAVIESFVTARQLSFHPIPYVPAWARHRDREC